MSRGETNLEELRNLPDFRGRDMTGYVTAPCAEALGLLHVAFDLPTTLDFKFAIGHVTRDLAS